MTSEAPCTPNQESYEDTTNVVDRNVNNICLQTGEEFSTEFLQDPSSLRRLPSIKNDVDHRLPKRVAFNFNQNQQLVYEDLTGILGLERMNSESSSEVSDYVPVASFLSEMDYKVHPNNLIIYNKRDYGATEHVSGNLCDETNLVRVTPTIPTTPPVYIVESPVPYHHFVMGFSDGSFSGKMKFLCSFGGRILPRPSDGKLRYVGGETRIISIQKNISLEELIKKTSPICNQPHTIKYQLPGEDLDALISVCSDEDLHHMLEEYQELDKIEGSQRLRLFLIPLNENESPSSVDATTTQPSDADYQYVVAVNGMLDQGPHKSFSGQSLTSQTSQAVIPLIIVQLFIILLHLPLLLMQRIAVQDPKT